MGSFRLKSRYVKTIYQSLLLHRARGGPSCNLYKKSYFGGFNMDGKEYNIIKQSFAYIGFEIYKLKRLCHLWPQNSGRYPTGRPKGLFISLINHSFALSVYTKLFYNYLFYFYCLCVSCLFLFLYFKNKILFSVVVNKNYF